MLGVFFYLLHCLERFADLPQLVCHVSARHFEAERPVRGVLEVGAAVDLL